MHLKRILLVTSAPPWPTNNGGRQRTFLLHQALSKNGMVDLICICHPRDYSEADMAVLRGRFNLLAMVPDSRPSMRFPWTLLERISPVNAGRAAQFFDFGRSLLKPIPKVLNELGDRYQPNEYDLVVGRYIRSIAAVGVPSDIPTCLDVDDLDTDYLKGKLSAPSNNSLHRFILRQQIGGLTKRLPEFLSKFTHIWVCNPRNQLDAGLSSASVLPNIPLLDAPSHHWQPLDFPVDSLEVGVVAAFRYAVNEEGLDWFLTEVWPHVLWRLPAARFKVYGSGISDEMRGRWTETGNVEVVGFVDEVVDAYRNSALMVCPVLMGGGTNIKVIEAAAFGRVCVMSMSATRGFREYADLREMLQYGEDAIAMADVIVRLLKAEEYNQKIAMQCASAFERLFSLDNFNASVHDGVARALEDFSQ